ncbi:bifunctional tetrahydrofolate synthase/dihydrofolate synthase [Parahaliea sp. F7430]|uniref:Dihydrofolate synthase/folylpolyglutamate synthase n=1 Tax=Sediminihaliea albiluteola TaxID=2758564 RepID=A0A7W2TU92_9GAMM|nr:bifunctional tetrahydrofolate synthase/dihydrofolate synthase [Sediminihaliea albiluteola]MBA6412043.1 bifunctional tetrahydrofolate synthase/dihydrofolate synthase [Sediminihaliea albiluteola]
MSDNDLGLWLQRLEQRHPNEIDLGLERVGEVAERLGLLPLTVPVLTIAGTNGKGSTAAALESLLLQLGRRPGVFSSPHLLRFNERIRVAGFEASDEDIVAAFARIEEARGDISLSYFEFATLAALLVFRSDAADVVVLEVGLGGRLDAVNIVDASVAVITSIALDHQQWLGDDIDAIGREKAGVLRAQRPAVIAEPAPSEGLLQAIAESAAEPYFIGRDFFCDEQAGTWQARVRSADGSLIELEPQPQSPIIATNLCAALQALSLLGEDVTHLELSQALADFAPVGRRQSVAIAGRDYILDVAHNPHSVEKLLEYLQLNPCEGKTIALFSAMEDKAVRDIIRLSAASFTAWFLADQPSNPRAAKAADIAAMLRDENQYMISVSKNLRQAFRRAQSLITEQDRLVVFGSFSTVAELLPLLEKDRNRK